MTRTLLELDNDVAEFSRGVAETCTELGAKLSATMATLAKLEETVAGIQLNLSQQEQHLRYHLHDPVAEADAEPEQPKTTPGKRADLLAACEALLDDLGECVGASEWGDRLEDDMKPIDDIRAAVLKAQETTDG